MTREDLVNNIAEEISVGIDLGRDYYEIAINICDIIDGKRTHEDYDYEHHVYVWEGGDELK